MQARKRIFAASLVGAMLFGGVAVAQVDIGGQDEGLQEPGMGGGGQAGQQRAGAQRGMDDKQAIFKAPKEQSYEVQGTITEQRGRDLTIARQGMPVIKLRVEDQTSLNFPGQRITPDNLNEIPVGSEVRARFQVVEDDVIALSVEHAGKPGMQQPGMQQPGMQQPGMQQPGQKQPQPRR
jgi:hypothetical protein